MDNDERLICICCEEEVDPDFAMYSSAGGEPLCESCHDGDLQHAATIYYMHDGEVDKIYVGHYITMTEYGDPVTKLDIGSKWVSTTSSWRGYHDVFVQDFCTVLDGWTTGFADDEVGRRKRYFNMWAQDVLDGVEVSPVPFVLITSTTSNLFSTAIAIQVDKQYEAAFKEWLGETYDLLYESLS